MSKKPHLAALFGANEATTFLGLEPCEDLAAIDASSVSTLTVSRLVAATMGLIARQQTG